MVQYRNAYTLNQAEKGEQISTQSCVRSKYIERALFGCSPTLLLCSIARKRSYSQGTKVLRPSRMDSNRERTRARRENRHTRSISLFSSSSLKLAHQTLAYYRNLIAIRSTISSLSANLVWCRLLVGGSRCWMLDANRTLSNRLICRGWWRENRTTTH